MQRKSYRINLLNLRLEKINFKVKVIPAYLQCPSLCCASQMCVCVHACVTNRRQDPPSATHDLLWCVLSCGLELNLHYLRWVCVWGALVTLCFHSEFFIVGLCKCLSANFLMGYEPILKLGLLRHTYNKYAVSV